MTSTLQAGLETTSGRGQREPAHPYAHSVAPCESALPSIFVDPLANRPSSVDYSAETGFNEYEGRPLEFITAGMTSSGSLQILPKHHMWEKTSAYGSTIPAIASSHSNHKPKMPPQLPENTPE
ncbi:hypothetical protein SynBIOSE41_01064 [Synechococcus sp. BIOS-E4-1]|nr:hypothetical protein SynBIOSE41_01064 [Synechococcus sp. BIOS-E4-1]